MTNLRVESGSNYRAHLAMALKVFEMPPADEMPGDVVECGTWKGASASNLSIVCRMVGRKLIVCDSFEGLPQPLAGTPDANFYKKGDYEGALEEVHRNILKCGEISVCEFVKGWFQDTLPMLKRPLVLAWIDVDLEESLEVCVRNLWPLLHLKGFMFLDESVGIQYTALFFSESWWKKHFNSHPPGFIGAGSGLALGQYYIGPIEEMREHPAQYPGTAGYTSRSFDGSWRDRENRQRMSPSLYP